MTTPAQKQKKYKREQKVKTLSHNLPLKKNDDTRGTRTVGRWVLLGFKIVKKYIR
jgi:hypothetical protein